MMFIRDTRRLHFTPVYVATPPVARRLRHDDATHYFAIATRVTLPFLRRFATMLLFTLTLLSIR